ncbi:MAG: hypothetical protein IJN85_02945 [Oscillospiraceae bacterium]|nr:hypothetical protein [Oscillospiraceae bacterium]
MKNKKVKILIFCLVGVLVCAGITVAAITAVNDINLKNIEKTRIKLESEVVVEPIKLDENYVHYFEQYGIAYDGSMKVDKDYTSYATVGFINNDNSRTLFAFASDVNYKSDGKFVPIDIRVKNTTQTEQQEKGYVYSVAGNNVDTLFNKVFDSQKGIIIADKDLSFEVLAPKGSAGKATYEVRKNFIDMDRAMIGYSDVAAEGTSTYFYPSNLGVNCEIVCSEKASHKLSFDLLVNTQGVKVRQEPGGYWIIYESNKKGWETILGVIQMPIIKDAEGNFIRTNDIKLHKKPDGKYAVKLLLDKNADLAGATVYLAFEIRKGNQPDNALYSGLPNLKHAYLKNHVVIGQSEDLGIGRLMMLFGVESDYLFSEDMITSVDFFIYNLTPNDTMTVTAYRALEEWCSLVGNWNCNYKIGDSVSTAKAGESVIKLDITDEFKFWCGDGNGDIENYGLQLRADETDNNHLILFSGDNTLFSNYTKIVFNKKAEEEKQN